MLPERHSTGGQDPTHAQVQPPPGISPAAWRYMNMRAEATPGSPPAAADPGNGGQGPSEGGGTPKGDGGGFNWELFPDVPEVQRPLLEPHLKQVQGHVTQLEQRFSPWKPLIESGVDPGNIQGLLSLDQQFAQDPIGTFIQLGRNMQQEGVLNGDLDFDAVHKILNGEEIDEGEGEEVPPAGGEGEEEIPPWGQQILQHLQQQQQQEEERTTQTQAQQRQQLLQKAMGEMKAQLLEAGYQEDQITDEMLRGTLLATNGDQNKAVESLVGLRSGVLKSHLKPGNEGSNGSGSENDDGPTMPNGPPSVPKSPGRGPGRDFAEARKGAEQFLSSKLNAEAQGQ